MLYLYVGHGCGSCGSCGESVSRRGDSAGDSYLAIWRCLRRINENTYILAYISD